MALQARTVLPNALLPLPNGLPNVHQDQPNALFGAEIVVVFFFETPKMGRESHIHIAFLYIQLFKMGVFDPG